MIPSSSRIGQRTSSAASSGSAGAVTDEQFRVAFEAVPEIRVNSLKDLVAESQKYSAILENVNNDWTKRIKALQSLRSLIKHDIGCYQAFAEQAFQLLGTAFQLSVKDLRSQVCRETCITLAYYCEKLGLGMWRVAESVLPVTMNLTQNAAKVMASSGQICNIYIAKNVQHSKVLSIIAQHISSKAKEIRRMTIALVSIAVSTWETSVLEKHWPEVTQCIKLALSDADPEARSTARQAFENLQTHYSTKADALFHELEPAKQRLLAGRSSTASSTHSINSERDNLPNPNRGLYHAQNAFLNKRSASDLNHSVRRLNLAVPRVVHRPNVVRSGKPPQVMPMSAQRTNPSTPTTKKIAPVPASTNRLQKSGSTTDAKAASQPGSRSNSPSRNRPPPRPNVQMSAKKIPNGRDNNTGITNTPVKPSAQPAHREIVRALKNVDMQARSVRPNVIRSDDPRAYANSAGANLMQPTHFNARMSNSPQDFYGLSQKQEAALHRINSTEEYSSDLGGRRKSSANNSTDKQLSPQDEFENAQNKWSYLSSELLANDSEQQIAFIQEVCDAIGADDLSEKEIADALLVLTRMIREEGITLWNDYFNTVFFAIQQIIANQQYVTSVKISALRCMKELCVVQPKRLVTKTELLLMNILNAHECDDATTVRAAEDCGTALAAHLPTNTCMNLLLTVIDDPNSKYHQLSGGIKMLSNVIAKLPTDEVEKLLPTVVPRMTQCYENSQSMVRRAAIICLVSISNSIGLETLKPHLNQSTLKLVEVYRDRMAKKSADGGSS